MIGGGGCEADARRMRGGCEADERDFIYYLAESGDDVTRFDFGVDQEVVDGAHGQDGDAVLLGQHGSGGHEERRGQPRPLAQPQQGGRHVVVGAVHHFETGDSGARLGVAPVAQQRQQEEDGRTHVGAPHDPGHGFRVDRVGGEEQRRHGTGQPPVAPQQRPAQHGKETRRHAVQQHVHQVVSARLQSVPPFR